MIKIDKKTRTLLPKIENLILVRKPNVNLNGVKTRLVCLV